MTTKQAIAWCEKTLGKGDWPEVFIIIDALRASQKREQEVFKALSVQCIYNDPECAGDTCSKNNFKKCTLRNCPLLKPVEKPFSDCKKKGKK